MIEVLGVLIVETERGTETHGESEYRGPLKEIKKKLLKTRKLDNKTKRVVKIQK